MARNSRSHSLTETGRFARLKWLVVFATLFVFSCTPSVKKTSTRHETPSYAAELFSDSVADGSLNIINVHFVKPFQGKLTGKFEEKTFAFYPLDESAKGASEFQALFGVPHAHAPGKVAVTVEPEGHFSTDLSFEIVDGKYPSETLKVDNRKVNPRKKDLVRIKKEMVEIGEVYRTETLKRYWKDAFIRPVESPLTDSFGIKRLYNGQLRNFHGGLDFKAPMGTPIHAAGSGRVILAKDLFYSGGTVIIDHGYGLLTMYFHMSKIGVKKDQMVESNDLLGLSGKSGRVTGPHLHFQVVVHQVKVNPMGLFEELR